MLTLGNVGPERRSEDIDVGERAEIRLARHCEVVLEYSGLLKVLEKNVLSVSERGEADGVKCMRFKPRVEEIFEPFFFSFET